jgi:hypothetical protein
VLALRSVDRTSVDRFGPFYDGVGVGLTRSLNGIGGWAITGEGAVERAREGLAGGLGDEPGVVDDRPGGGLGVVGADDCTDTSNPR